MNVYDKQAETFLRAHDLTFAIERAVPNECPPFCDEGHEHGDKWWVSLLRNEKADKLCFPFWDSKHDKDLRASSPERRDPEKRRAQKGPYAYDVLACISGAVSYPETFEAFCSEYAYSEDSRKAERFFVVCLEFSKKLQAFFTAEELDDLSQIQ